MSQSTTRDWETLRTPETDEVVAQLSTVFPSTDAYRYNAASIRVRVVDPRFEGKSTEDRDAMVEPLIERLPERTRADIINLLVLAPSELTEFSRGYIRNTEFEHPSQSML